jgi:Flp pilus assembly protein TadD
MTDRLRWTIVVIWIALAWPAHAILTEENSGLDQEPSFRAAKQAVASENWDAAVKALELVVVNRPDNADAHAWLGYSLRRAGRYDAALQAYDEALRLSPRNLAAREYLGEAYLALGRRADAMSQLLELDRLCGVASCEEARQLRHAIEAQHAPVTER